MSILQRFTTTKVSQNKQEKKHMGPGHQIVNCEIAAYDTAEHKGITE